MKILIIEDNQENIEAAKVQLSDHELTVCSSFEEANDKLSAYDNNGISISRDRKLSYDVMLTDLFLPASKEGVVGWYESFKGSEVPEMPYGFVFALSALMYTNISKVAIVTTTDNHHDNPMMWAAGRLLGLYDHKRFKTKDNQKSFLIIPNMPTPDSKVKNWKKALDMLVK